MLAKSKLNSIETLMSQALIDLEISYEEFKTNVNEKQRYVQMKEDISNIKSNDELRKKNRNNKKNIESSQILKKMIFFCIHIKWLEMCDIQTGLGVKNMSDLAIKEIEGIYGKKGKNLKKTKLKM